MNKISVKYSLHVILPFVVPPRPPVVDAVVYQILTKQRHVPICSNPRRVEPFLHTLYRLIPLHKTRHRRSVTRIHQLAEDQDSMLMLIACIVPLIKQFPKLCKGFRL